MLISGAWVPMNTKRPKRENCPTIIFYSERLVMKSRLSVWLEKGKGGEIRK